jgi:hypothetical protein
MLKWLKFWEQRTVDTITASLHWMVQELEAHVDEHVSKAIDLKAEAAVALAKADAASEEANKAAAVAGKIRALVS